jgi:transcriptional regulator NrdR family protein
MPSCKHESTEYIGEQKTDDGVNIYRRCKSCGIYLVLLPTGKLIGIKAVPKQLTSGSQKSQS